MKSSPSLVIIALIVAIGSWYLKQEESSTPSDQPSAAESVSSSPQSGKLGGYDVLQGCQLVESHRNNDGDSFMVKHGKGETEFRIYFVDAPESQYKEYRNGENNGQRLRQQGDYFGRLNRKETVLVGAEAKELTIKLLSIRPFTVMTKWQNVYGPQRRYAFILVNVDGRETYLHELLVAKGLGRIHTRGATLPSGVSTSQQKQKLLEMEKKAKNARRGAWAM